MAELSVVDVFIGQNLGRREKKEKKDKEKRDESRLARGEDQSSLDWCKRFYRHQAGSSADLQVFAHWRCFGFRMKIPSTKSTFIDNAGTSDLSPLWEVYEGYFFFAFRRQKQYSNTC